MEILFEKDLEGEIWKLIPKEICNLNYLVSSHGRFKTSKGVIIKGSLDQGYIRISLNCKAFFAHKIVCEIFNGKKPFPEAIVMHLDDNKQNNHKDNLKWGTTQENTQSAADNNLFDYEKIGDKISKGLYIFNETGDFIEEHKNIKEFSEKYQDVKDLDGIKDLKKHIRRRFLGKKNFSNMFICYDLIVQFEELKI